MVVQDNNEQMLAMDVLAYDKMKGNRRKQSKPIRVSNNPDGEGLEPSKFAEQPENEFPSNDNDDRSESETFDVRSEKELEINGRDKAMTENNNKLMSSFQSSNSESYPTKYHRLGSELFQPAFPTNGNSSPEALAMARAHMNGEDRMNEMRDKTPNSDEEGKKVEGGNRIFHQDAYCEICDREFCNKYFLKTHRANKHGIFDTSTSPVSTMGSVMPLPQDIITSASPVQPPTLTTSSSFKVMDFIQNLPATEPKIKKPETPKPLKPESKSPLMPNPPSTPTTPVGSNVSSNGNTSNSNSKPVSKDMEDFCELCQKHFCNKYYLKKHKNDVHGIAPPDGSSTTNKRGRPKDLQAQLDAITSSTLSLGNPTSSASGLSSFMPPHSMPSMPGLPNMPPGVMVLNPFMAPMLLHAGGLMPGQGGLPTPPMMSQPPPTSPTPPPMPSRSSANTPPPSSGPTSAGEQASSSNGALNQEAYCDLCQKEFCNKYFLKIHRANKHGVFFDDFPFGPPVPPYKMPPMFPEKPTSDKMDAINDDEKKQDSSPKAGTSLVSNQDNSGTYCNLCNQEFASKYTYRIHRIQIHGMLNEAYEGALMEDIMKNTMKDRLESQMKISPNSLAKMEMDDYFNNRMMENGMSTMFSNMVAAKLADRVTCDICNKVLCNKYFLKVHKQKVHGVEPTPDQDLKLDISKSHHGDLSPAKPMKMEPSDPSPKLPSSFGPTFPMSFPKTSDAPLDMSPNSVEKPSKEELVKMGIDPEAYCEICKKEFCSKYFLRTHKLNIHGIRSDKPETPETDKMAFLNMNMSMSLSQPTMAMNPSSLAMAMSQNNKPLNLSLNGNKKAKNGYEKHSWRWKEPVNSSRVICEICNKEVCNKYFLRTHKLNKHGILPSETSLSPSRNSPYQSEFDAQSNSSLPTDLSMKDRNSSSPIPMHHDGHMSRPSSIYGHEHRRDSDENEGSEYSYAEICQLCDQRFKSLKHLKHHIVKDHGMIPPARKGLFEDNRVCRMCDASFPSELAMHLHMIQEHNAQVSLNTSENERENMPPTPRRRKRKSRYGLNKLHLVTKQRYYSCSQCDFRSKWLNNLSDHELKVHNIAPRNGQKLGDIVNNQSRLGKYKCTKCNRKFPSAILCNRHIREEHIRKKDFAVVKSNTRHSCEKCSFSTRFVKQLQRHVERVHCRTPESCAENGEDYSGKNDCSDPLNLQSQTMNKSDCEMQAFKIKDCSSVYSDFVTTVVQMPVRHHVSAPVTVTFHLTPMEQ